ncbi:MAG: polymerase sigma factor, sigma-70 family [Verrucomicrobiales bacterium]|nr:polymerase sigma factor, sigma-70 family [Verrucomicrobiales bacterium]
MNETAKADWVRSALERHESSLLRYAASITGDAERARDIVQDTFLRMCAEEPAALEGKLTEWLFIVCRNRALDVQRKEKRMTPLTEIDLETRASADPSPALAAETRDTTANALQFLNALPPNQREVIRLKFQSGLSYQEISRVTELSVTNVGFLIHTGIKTLRQKMNTMERSAR